MRDLTGNTLVVHVESMQNDATITDTVDCLINAPKIGNTVRRISGIQLETTGTLLADIAGSSTARPTIDYSTKEASAVNSIKVIGR